MRKIAPPIESELSIWTGTFLNNYDVRDRNLKLSVIRSTLGIEKNERPTLQLRLLILKQVLTGLESCSEYWFEQVGGRYRRGRTV